MRNRKIHLEAEPLAELEAIQLRLRYAIADRRIELTMTQAAFGKLVGCPSTSLSYIEARGTSSSGSPSTLDRLVTILLSSGLKREDIARIIAG